LILPTHRLLDAASEASKGKAKIGSTLKGIGPTYMDKTGRNGIRVGDIELADFNERYRALADKHEAMIAFYDVNIQYNLAEMEKEFFEAIEDLKKLDFIDSEEYLAQAQKEHSIMIGDCLEADVQGALDFGIDALFFNPNKENTPENIIAINHLLELKNYL
jgi:adenylosuccinate synthase